MAHYAVNCARRDDHANGMAHRGSRPHVDDASVGRRPATGQADHEPDNRAKDLPGARRLTAPLRAINGDLFPTDVPAIRKVKADFDAVIMKHMGHYPMLERPAEFDALVERIVTALCGPRKTAGSR